MVYRVPELLAQRSFSRVGAPDALEQEYAEWRRIQQMRVRISDVLANLGLAETQATVLLENALMFDLLDSTPRSPTDGLRHVTEAGVRAGLDAIQRPDVSSADVTVAIREVAAQQRVADAEVRTPITVDDSRVMMGSFSLEWSRPVARAYHSLSQSLPRTEALRALVRAGLRYDSIFAKTRHIGPPQSVYDDFYAWGVRNEGFASPFNARLLGKPGARFFSAFPDTDHPFGSHGSFFDHFESPSEGGWCLDPPFLPETMRRVDDAIATLRAAPSPPAVVLIVPASHRVANEPDETVVLQKDVHVVEGLGDTFFTLPVDVTVHRYGELDGFSADAIRAGYSHPGS